MAKSSSFSNHGCGQNLTSFTRNVCKTLLLLPGNQEKYNMAIYNDSATAGKISSIKSIKSVNVYQKQTYLFSTIAPTQQNSELRAKEQKTATTIKIIYTTILHQLDARGNAASSWRIGWIHRQKNNHHHLQQQIIAALRQQSTSRQEWWYYYSPLLHRH